MWFQFGIGGRRDTQGDAQTRALAESDKKSGSTVRGLWADCVGLTSTRSLQTILVVVLLTGIVFGLRQLTLVVIPVLLALIFASAFAPVMRWFRRRGMPSLLSTVLVLIFILAILTGVGWLIVWTVRDQADELVADRKSTRLNSSHVALSYAV